MRVLGLVLREGLRGLPLVVRAHGGARGLPQLAVRAREHLLRLGRVVWPGLRFVSQAAVPPEEDEGVGRARDVLFFFLFLFLLLELELERELGVDVERRGFRTSGGGGRGGA